MSYPFKIPFATSGNQAVIPDSDLSGNVNFTDGYTPDYELDPSSDPNAKLIERDKMNFLFNRITAAIGEVQRNGAAEWYSALAPYGLGSVVARAGKIWQSTVTNNSTEPGDVGASWVDITALAATETAVGRVLLASQADAEPATIGASDNTKAMTPLRVFQALGSPPASLIVRPVGSHYVQFAESDGSFSAAKSPSTLFGGTWSLKFNTESAFFRTEGTLAAEGRSGGVQGDAIRNITGGSGTGALIGDASTLSGAFAGAASSARATTGSTYGTTTFNFDASREVPTATENRVKNRLIRVWERTA